MRLELSAGEKRSTLLLKGERDLAGNSTTVLTMESRFLEQKVKRSDLTAFNYNSLIHFSGGKCGVCARMGGGKKNLL